MCTMCQLTDTDEDLLSAMLMQKDKTKEVTAASAPEDAVTKKGHLRGCPQPQRVNGVRSIAHSSAAHRAPVSSNSARVPCCSTACPGLLQRQLPVPAELP